MAARLRSQGQAWLNRSIDKFATRSLAPVNDEGASCCSWKELRSDLDLEQLRSQLHGSNLVCRRDLRTHAWAAIQVNSGSRLPSTAEPDPNAK